MTRAAGKQPAPRALLTLLIAIEGLVVPDDVTVVLRSIQFAVFDKNPRAALSRRCCRLREARPGAFRSVWRWLKTPEVVEAVQRNGAYWTLRVWRRACADIERGVKPHVAFGMDKGGRPVEMHFSAVDNAAMWAEYLHQCLGVPSELAGECAQTFAGLVRGDRRTIQMARDKYKSCGETLGGLPAALRLKYPRFKELLPAALLLKYSRPKVLQAAVLRLKHPRAKERRAAARLKYPWLKE